MVVLVMQIVVDMVVVVAMPSSSCHLVDCRTEEVENPLQLSCMCE